MINLQERRAKLERMKGQKEALSKEIKTIKKKYLEEKDNYENSIKAQEAMKIVALETQQGITYQLCDMVTLALNTVFEDSYDFNIEFVDRRGKTEADLSFRKNDEEYDPMTDSGGGVVDVAAFALRVSLWSLSKKNNTIVSDEPMKFLSRELQPKASELLKMLSCKLGIQFIIVTHDKALMESADQIFTIDQDEDGVSFIAEEEIE